MFIIGEKVVYPVHGAGIIEAIEKREILGEVRNYYVLRLCTGDLKVLVPVDTVSQAGMRPICGREQLDQVRDILRHSAPVWEDNWNRRYRANMDKIKSGDICQLAEVVRNLSLRDAVKGLSAGEKKMLDNAKKILVSELVLAAGQSTEEANQELDAILQASRE